MKRMVRPRCCHRSKSRAKNLLGGNEVKWMRQVTRETPHPNPDTTLRVMHQRGKPSMKQAPPELVNNSAVDHAADGQQLATPEIRLPNPYATRVRERSPTPALVAGPSAERTLPHEGSCIRLRTPRRSGSLQTARIMNANAWSQHTHFAALDWASDHHDVVIVDHNGGIVAEFRFAHTAAGWAEFTEKMKPYGGAPIALETSSGPAVDQLLQSGWTLYPVNPKAAELYRERKCPTGTKTDRH